MKRLLILFFILTAFTGSFKKGHSQTVEEWVSHAKTLRQSSPDSAVHYFHQAAERLLEAGKGREAATILFEAGVINTQSGQITDAIETLGRAHEMTRELRDSLHHAIKIDLAFAYFISAEVDTALVLLNQAAQFFEGKDPRAFAYALNTRGSLLSQSGLFHDALLDYQKAFGLFMSEKDSNEASKVSNSMGHISATLGDFEEAMHYYEQARLFFRGEGQDHHEAVVLLNEGTAYWKQGDYEEAIRTLDQAESLASGLKDERLTEIILGEKSITYAKLREFDKALEYNRKGMELALKNNYTASIARYGMNQGFIFLDMEKPLDAIGTCREALAISKVTENQSLMADNCNCLYRAFKGVGQVDSALKYFELATAWKDSLFNVEKVRSVTRHEMELKNVLARQRLEAESERAQLIAAQKMESQQGLLVFVLVAMGLLVLVLIFMVRAYRIKQRTNQLITTEKALQENLLQNIVHEFRTPLTLIEGPLEQLSPKFSTDEDQAMFGIVKRNTNRLLVLVNQLLEMAKMKAGKLAPVYQETNLNLLLMDCLYPFEKEALAKGIYLESSIPTSISCETDPEFLQKIIFNLLSNAMKFTPKGGTISLAVKTGNRGLEIAVADTGIGISEEGQQRIFEKFYQVDAKTTRRAEGTGIGLAFALELAKSMGGDISVKSRIGEGSVFTLSLPVEVSHRPVTSGAIQMDITPETKNNLLELKEKTDNSAEGILLLVEDNEDMQQYIRTLMNEEGMKVVIAANGKEGFKAASMEIPDIIISDVMMPEMDGYELCQRVKEDIRTSHIPFILLTAKASQDSRLVGFERGADHYIGKPFHAGELKLLVRNALQQRRKIQERYLKEASSEKHEETLLETPDPFLQRLIKAISENLDNEERNTEDIARSIGISRSQLHRKLKGLTGMSSTQFVHAIKMLHARKMIEEKKFNVSEAAYAVGFKDPSYFTKIFIEHFGKTPSTFVQDAQK